MSIQETLSITKLQRMCAISEYLEESDIHMNDKTVSWDGNIIYYKNKKPVATGNEFLIPIQVKGKEYDLLPESDSIGYSVETKDLKNYLKNGGVIFFVDAIAKTEDKEKMYAKILLPVDIINIMEGKEEQGHITVHLDYIGTIRALEELCVLFNANRPKQAIMGVDKPIPDYENMTNFTVSTLPSQYTDPAIAIAKNPCKYFYYKKDGIEIPIVLTDVVTSTESKLLIKIDDKINHVYPVQHIYTEDQTILRISELIEIALDEKTEKMHIRCVECSDINFESVYQAAKIITAVPNAVKVSLENLELSKEFLEKVKSFLSERFIGDYKQIIQIGKIFEDLNIKKSYFKTKEVLDAERILYFLKSGLLEMKLVTLPFHTSEDCGIYKQKIGHKKLLLEYEKVQDNRYIIRNYFEDGKCIGIFQKDKDGKRQKISRWFALRDEDISEMLFDESKLLTAMKEIDYREAEQLLFLVLDCLKSFDAKKNERMLSLAEKLFGIAEKHLKDINVLTINKYQIIARRRELNFEEKKKLAQFKYSENIFARCCACILLKQFDEFEIHVSQLSLKEKEEFYSWPIAFLLPNEETEKTM